MTVIWQLMKDVIQHVKKGHQRLKASGRDEGYVAHFNIWRVYYVTEFNCVSNRMIQSCSDDAEDGWHSSRNLPLV